MDGTRFDHLARSVAGRGSRRTFMGGLVGLGGGLAGLRATEAQTCPPGRVSRRRVGCVCRRTGRPPVGGVCPCPRGQTDTGDGLGCLDCRDDGDCPVEAPCCRDGACRAVPPPTLADCQGRCDCVPPACDLVDPDDPRPASVVICGQTLTCPNCVGGCGAAGCPAANVEFDGPVGFGAYCTESPASTGTCPAGSFEECPAGSGCAVLGGVCFEICTGVG